MLLPPPATDVHANSTMPTERLTPPLKKKKDFTSFCQLTQPIACGRASATLPNVIHLCQTKCQRPPDRDALSTPYA